MIPKLSTTTSEHHTKCWSQKLQGEEDTDLGDCGRSMRRYELRYWMVGKVGYGELQLQQATREVSHTEGALWGSSMGLQGVFRGLWVILWGLGRVETWKGGVWE
ncbi:hypothetical protein KC19_3G172400 [Ceratodon purpureus]|uniref:Uncharacterized protein n=1 Tax=Ceratodon purpureus TaxID=3225 RepID=A0A8T0ILY5_CERPU|nr:hypothetical protein KC19_3G172400 [Ceratodon purpureus]